MIKDFYGNRRFYGVYRGIVIENKDPLNTYRLKLRIPQILHDQVSDWAWGIFPESSTTIPDLGTGVWVMFEGGDPSFPVWIGKFSPTVPDTPNVYGSYYQTSNQSITAINADTPVLFGTKSTSSTSGVNIDSSGNISVTKNGVFRITVVFEVFHDSGAGSGDYFYAWLNKNSSNVTNTGVRQRILSGHYSTVNMECIIALTTTDTAKIYWSSDNVSIILSTATTAGAGAPSARIIISQVG